MKGSGCVAQLVERSLPIPDTRGPRFESSHRQKFIEHLFTVSCIEKTKIKKKEAVNGPFLKKNFSNECEPRTPLTGLFF